MGVTATILSDGSIDTPLVAKRLPDSSYKKNRKMERIFFRAALISGILLFAAAAVGKTPAAEESRQDSLRRVRASREVCIGDRIALLEVMTPASEVPDLCFMPRQHPAQDSVPAAVREEVARRTRSLGRDSLPTAELLWALRPYLNWLQEIDPHLRVTPQPRLPVYTRKAMKAANNVALPGFLLLDIGDTLVVERSVDTLFRRGDRIVSINGVPAAKYLEYCYDDRTIYPFPLLANYRFELIRADGYRVLFERGGRTHEVTTPGIPWSKLYPELIRQQEFLARSFPQARAGYFAVTEFYPNNSLLIARLRKAIRSARERGFTSFILDLRGNPGGNGGRFDELLSIFIDKPVIPYLKGQRLRVCRESLHDFDFLTDSMLGRLVDVPEEYRVATVALDRKKYIPGMRYYVLMDKDSGSVAATFCNILQYNGAAQLVGEPLRRNALRYGEVIERWHMLTGLVMSIPTTEFDEHTRAADGVVEPDIPIPYVAAEYLSGRDAVLDRLLAIIAERQE